MTYYNLIFKRGLERFVDDCVDSHISGIIVPDLPIEESYELAKISRRKGVDLIFLIAPTTTDTRIKKITQIGTGFIYLVARLGVTGARKDIADSTKKLLSRVDARIPKAIGFGISNGRQAEEIIRAGADGVIVGSAFVDIIARKKNIYSRIEDLARELKKGVVKGSSQVPT
jgi:tryptophan synthase alpha chain